jgi:uncharacterized protein YijF (DUF1287 family)
MSKFLIIVLTTFLAGSIPASADDQGMLLVNSARLQIGKTVSYDPAYRSTSYPNGDVPIKTGVCSDVTIVSDRKTLLGRPYVLHNIGQGVKEEDRLFDFQHTGHFRIGQFKHSACE